MLDMRMEQFKKTLKQVKLINQNYQKIKKKELSIIQMEINIMVKWMKII